MAMHARPSPIDPYNPSGGEVLQHPSPYIPIRIPIFAPVTFLNDSIIWFISVSTRTAANLAGGGSSSSGISAMSGLGTGHRRTLSDGVESVEEGSGRESIEMNSIRPSSSSLSGRPQPTNTHQHRLLPNEVTPYLISSRNHSPGMSQRRKPPR